MPLLRSTVNNVFFIHIPKTGGTTIEKNSTNQGIRVEFHNIHTPNCMSQHLHINDLNIFYPLYQVYNPFAIIRDPWQRLCSEFIYSSKQENFNRFDEWFTIIMKSYKDNNYILDNHIRPQIEFISQKVQLFIQEKFHLVIDYINQHLNTSLEVKQIHNTTSVLKPDIDIFSFENKKIYENFYKNDIILYKKLKDYYV